MRRPILSILFLSLWVLIPAIMTAQDVPPPVTTEEPAVATEEPAQIVVPQGAVPIPTSTTGEQNLPQQVTAPPAAIDPLALPLLISARSDMELLAGQQLGAERPIGWSGSLDVNNPQLPLLTRLDLELLAGRLMAPDQRPVGWFGAVPGTTVSIVRDIRHDLERLADTVGIPNVRPNGWSGADPLIRCERGVQALVNVLERGGVFSLNVDGNDPNYCQLVELQASHFAETNILSSPTTTLATSASNPAASGTSGSAVAFSGSAQIDSAIAIAFLNRYGTEQVGKIPVGTSVEPVARSFTQFSAMTLVRGQDFEVFIDYRDSNLTADQFAVLPNVDNASVNTVCNASWCEPIIYTLGNPAAGRNVPPDMPVANPAASNSTTVTAASAGTNGKTQVPVQNLIINYDGQDDSSSTVVRMQLCSGATTTTGNVCQPVSLVIAPDGSTLQPVAVLNGQNQYRLPIGYSKYSPRTTNYFMLDIWINALGQR
ncbi:MAG: hypothetical protein ABI690_03205 [Chloroflexota bacterium]